MGIWKSEAEEDYVRWGSLPGEEGFRWVFEGGNLCSVISKGLPLQIASLGLGHVPHLWDSPSAERTVSSFVKQVAKYTTGLLRRLRWAGVLTRDQFVSGFLMRQQVIYTWVSEPLLPSRPTYKYGSIKRVKWIIVKISKIRTVKFLIESKGNVLVILEQQKLSGHKIHETWKRKLTAYFKINKLGLSKEIVIITVQNGTERKKNPRLVVQSVSECWPSMPQALSSITESEKKEKKKPT